MVKTEFLCICLPFISPERRSEPSFPVPPIAALCRRHTYVKQHAFRDFAHHLAWLEIHDK